MKNVLSLILLSLLVFPLTLLAQKPLEKRVVGYAHSYRIFYVGENAPSVAEAIFDHFKTDRNKYITKIKKVKIEGIDQPIHLLIHQGFSGELEKKEGQCKNGQYYSTFTRQRTADWFVENRKNHQTYFTSIMLTSKSAKQLNQEQFKLVESYIASIIS